VSTAKKEAVDLIERLPDSATTAEILEELLFKQQVEQGLEDVAHGRTMSHEELREQLAEWRTSTGG
jgi:predicted transcriptional regulator